MNHATQASLNGDRDAIDFAVKNAVQGSFIVVCSDVVPDALDQIMRAKEEEEGVVRI